MKFACQLTHVHICESSIDDRSMIENPRSPAPFVPEEGARPVVRKRRRGMTVLAGLCAVALALFGVNAISEAAGIKAVPRTTQAALATQASTVPSWTGTFDSFHTSPWISSWGTTSDTAQCQGAAGAFTCNWGHGNLAPVSDPTAPGTGQALKVTYPASSSPHSCVLGGADCVLGGCQFCQILATKR